MTVTSCPCWNRRYARSAPKRPQPTTMTCILTPNQPRLRQAGGDVHILRSWPPGDGNIDVLRSLGAPQQAVTPAACATLHGSEIRREMILRQPGQRPEFLLNGAFR